MLNQKDLEKIPVKIFKGSEEASVFVANEIAALVKILFHCASSEVKCPQSRSCSAVCG